jgi:hypothetical protein
MIVTLQGHSLKVVKEACAFLKGKGFPVVQIKNGSRNAMLDVQGFGSNEPKFLPDSDIPRDLIRRWVRRDWLFTRGERYKKFEEVWRYIATHESNAVQQ